MSDVLGVLIAFVSIILLLSMLVTGLVQGTQAALRLRSRNLLVGVASIIASVSPPEPAREPRPTGKDDTPADGFRDQLRRRVRSDSKQQAAELLNRSSIALVDQVPKENSWTRIVFGPKVSWADPAMLVAGLDQIAGSPGVQSVAAQSDDTESKPKAQLGATGSEQNAPTVIERQVTNLGPALSRRFQFFIRLWTIFWSLVVAGAYQVSAPELMSALARGDIPTDPYVAQLDSVLALAEGLLTDPRYLDLVAQAALDELSARYPADSDLIAEVGTGGATRAQLLQELTDVVAGSPRGAELGLAYSALLDQMAGARDAAVLRDVEAVTRQLAAFDIEFWGEDTDFYYERAADNTWRIHWDALIGVLLTAILLSFGAPFWFEQLRNLAALKDLRAGGAAANAPAGAARKPIAVTEASDGTRQIRIE